MKTREQRLTQLQNAIQYVRNMDLQELRSYQFRGGMNIWGDIHQRGSAYAESVWIADVDCASKKRAVSSIKREIEYTELVAVLS